MVSVSSVERDIIANGLTVERARLFFSLAFGPLPGVTLPSNVVRDQSLQDGTPAVDAIYLVWDQLTDEQRAAAAARMHTPTTPTGTAWAAGRERVVQAGFTGGDTAAWDYGSMLESADEAIAAAIGQPAIKFIYDVDYGAAPQSVVFAETFMWWRVADGKLPAFNDWHAYPGNACHTTIYNDVFAPLSKADAESALAHEMFHCYQDRAIGNAKDALTVHWWIGEGEPNWVMATVIPAEKTVLAAHWARYATTPATPYSQRGADGVGVFGHLSDVAGNNAVWPKLLPAVQQAIGGNDLDPFNTLIQGNETSYFSSWGASFFLVPNTLPWTIAGPGQPPTSGTTPDSMTVDDGTMTTVSGGGSYQSKLLDISGSADIVGIGLLSGYGRVHDYGFGLDTILDGEGTLALCVKAGGCTCPDGSAGASLVTKRATAPISVGLNGGPSASEIGVGGWSLDKFCKDPDKPTPPAPASPGGGGGGGGGDNPPADPAHHNVGSSGGDTHITTFDGVHYDFQAIGEYTLVRSTADNFAVQVRQVPVLKSNAVSVTQAVATKLGKDRVSITLENGAAVFRVNGTVVTDAVPKLAGGSIVRSSTMYGPTYQFEWPDGTTAHVAQLGKAALNVEVAPAATRRGTLAGLLGNDDDSPGNDLVGAGGALGATPGAQDLNHALADHWRVTPEASLFDYQRGQSTATFTDTRFPDPSVDPSRAASRADAEQKCRQSGVTDPRLLADCIVDFAMTSDFVFASSYSHAQQVLAARAALAPAAAGSGLLRTVLMAGTVADPKAQPSISFAANAGDIVWIGQPDCSDNYLQMTLVDPNGKGLGVGGACGIGRHVMPANGTYVLRTYRPDNPTGAYRVPIRFIRADRERPVAYGDVVAGRIETRGVHDFYTFSAHAGDLLRIAGEGCNLDGVALGVITAAGADIGGPSCRSGDDFRVPATGNYKLLVNDMDYGPAAYHFVLQGASGR